MVLGSLIGMPHLHLSMTISIVPVVGCLELDDIVLVVSDGGMFKYVSW